MGRWLRKEEGQTQVIIIGSYCYHLFLIIINYKKNYYYNY
jgi:hypothetical protein